LTDLEKLYDEIENDGVDVVDAYFSGTKKAACLHSDEYKAIIMDMPQISGAAEERCVLAEEYAHYETGATYYIEATHNSPTGMINRMKYEAKAKRRAIERLLPFDEMKAALKAGYYEYELLEHFGVTSDFLQDAFELYNRLGYSFNGEEV
jgi:Zn-dependent peptidase ImmA (M78 family)